MLDTAQRSVNICTGVGIHKESALRMIYCPYPMTIKRVVVSENLRTGLMGLRVPSLVSISIFG